MTLIRDLNHMMPATFLQLVNKNFRICPATLNQSMMENLGIKIKILDSLFINETRIKNIKNSQNMRAKVINFIIVLIVKTLLSIGQFTYLNINSKN